MARIVSAALGKAATKPQAGEVDALVASLATLGRPAVPHLADALSDPREDVRLFAAEALARIGGDRAVESLLAALGDASADVRLRVVEKLGELRARRAVAPLLEQYGTDGDPQVRYECLTSLGLIGDRAAVDLLVTETSSPDRYARMWAMDALCEMGVEQASPLALSLLTDPDRYVREQVLRSCGRAFDTPPGHRALIELALEAPDFQTSVWARRHLHAYLERAPPRPELREAVRTAARDALGGAAAVRGALLLGDLGDPAATRPLIRAMDDPDPWVRHHAAYLLGRLGDQRAVPALVAALGDRVPLVARTAYDALDRFAREGDARAQDAIRNYGERRPVSR